MHGDAALSAPAWLHDVAAHLSDLAGVPWAVRDSEHHPGEAWYLRRLRIDGGALYASPPRGYSDRLQRATHLAFTACWPRYAATGREIRPRKLVARNGRRSWWDASLERTVRTDRPARTVARELHRHILTPYEALYSEAWGEQQRELRHDRETNAFADELVALGGERLERERPTVCLGRVTFEATGDADVRLRDAYVSREVARKIATILSETRGLPT